MCSSRFLPLNQDQFVLDFTSNFGGAAADQNVDFAAHAKLAREINPRLDREAGVGNNFAAVFGFEIVHVGSVAVHWLADGMPRTIPQLFPIPALRDLLSP